MGVFSYFSFFDSFEKEFLLVIEFVLCLLFTYIFFKFFGRPGLYVFGVLAVVIANLQVLKLANLHFFSHSIALGTVIFTCTYFISDVLTELYGPRDAFLLTGLSFLTMLVLPIFMLITLSYSGISNDVDRAIDTLFSPGVRILISSLSAFLISQACDIMIFNKIKKSMGGRMLLLRSAVSLTVAAIIDIVVFSSLAWVVLAPDPVDMHTLWYSYILSSLIIRLVVTFCFSPFMYVFKRGAQ